jgi:hypothetical protein
LESTGQQKLSTRLEEGPQPAGRRSKETFDDGVMSEGKIRYDILASEALRGIIRTVLQRVQKRGLPGDHHFFINFDTCAAGVILSKRLKDRYPVDMTIVLQHKFWDLMVFDDRFEVKLTFANVPERLVIPFAAIKSFVDPSVQFGFNPNLFAPAGSEEPDPQDLTATPTAPVAMGPGERAALPRPVPAGQADRAVASGNAAADHSIQQEEQPTPTGKVVELDLFRKR